MKKLTLIAGFLLLLSGHGLAQNYRELDIASLEELISRDDGKCYVVHFWATWCSPCLKELPHFEDLHRESANKDLVVCLVSLDFPNQAERRLAPFLEEKDISAPVYLMTNIDYNAWIDRVEPSWSGAIPATLIYRAGKRSFFEKEMGAEELRSEVDKFL